VIERQRKAREHARAYRVRQKVARIAEAEAQVAALGV
jgi:hypothetical protein